jgi:hypothetical protein
MIDPQSQKKVQTAISHRMAQDRHLLGELRRDVRPLRDQARQIQPRTALGEMMHHLGARRPADLSYMVPAAASATPSGRLTSFCRSTGTRPPATVERPDFCRLAPAPAACGQPVAFPSAEVLRGIAGHNRQEFTKAEPRTTTGSSSTCSRRPT